MLIQESAEMYLETILILGQKNGVVRAVDIAVQMGYARPSVSERLKELRESGLVQMDNGCVMLTEKGLEIARATYERHNAIARLFMELGVPEQTAYEDACRVEHYVSAETFGAIKRHVASPK